MDDGRVSGVGRGGSMTQDTNEHSMEEQRQEAGEAKPQTRDVFFVPRRPALMSTQDGQSSSIWLVSFTDVIALMLTFFVLLYAMSDPVKQKWEYKMGMTIEGTAEYSGGAGNAGTNEGANINRIDYRSAQNLDYVEAIFRELLKNAGVSDVLTIKRTEEELRLSFSQKILDVETDDDVKSLVKRLAPMLNNLDNTLTLVATLQNPDRAGQVFTGLQTVGNVLNRYGYHKPVIVALRGDIDVPADSMDILVKPHDGRRITR